MSRGFNRTFMELKDVSGVSLPPTKCGFQSHLYGIERMVAILQQTRSGVSIAPLWNWKRLIIPRCSLAVRFNRTFMELKVGRTLEKVLKCDVSIAPLWNWKVLISRMRLLAIGFNRTFMELKDEVEVVDVVRPVVSIAPLWNWKEELESI